MAWTSSTPTSRVFTQALLNPITRAVNAATAPTSFVSLTGDTINVSLFNNTTSPDASAAVGSTGYNTGTWVTGNEVVDTLNSNWAAGGRPLVSPTWAVSAAGSQTTPSVISYINGSAANTSGAGTLTITNAFGVFVYDNTISGGTVSKQGICFNYLGGGQTVTAGTFAVQWDATGIFKISN